MNISTSPLSYDAGSMGEEVRRDEPEEQDHRVEAADD